MEPAKEQVDDQLRSWIEPLRAGYRPSQGQDTKQGNQQLVIQVSTSKSSDVYSSSIEKGEPNVGMLKGTGEMTGEHMLSLVKFRNHYF